MTLWGSLRRWATSLSGWQRAGLVAGLAAALLIELFPGPLAEVPDMGRRPVHAAAVVAVMALFWLSEAVPMTVTACLPAVAYPWLGVFGGGPMNDLGRAIEPYADAYIFLFLGGMAIGAAMEEQGLHRRVALHLLFALGTSPPRLLLGILTATALLSLWISNTATAVMMLPIALALLRQIEGRLGGARLVAFGSALMLAVAYGANLGGVGTKIGTGTNSIFAGYAARELGRDLGFLEFMLVATPFVLLFLPVTWAVLWRLGRRDAPRLDVGREVIGAELAALGPSSRGERKVAGVFLLAASLWVLGDVLRPPLLGALRPFFGALQSKHYEAGVAMAAGALLVPLGVLGRSTISRIPFGTLLLLGGSFAMAAGIEGSGLSRWLSAEMAGVARLPESAQLLMATGSAVALSAVASNTATISVLLNVLPQRLPVLFAATLGASADFMLPAGTPPNAIVFGSGVLRTSTMMRTGFLLDLLAVLVISAWVAFAYALGWLG